MNSTIWNKKNSKKSRLDLAKEALFTLITKLKENDHIGITSFNTNSQVIQSMISAKDLVNNEQFTNSILSMKAKFGTNLYEGLKGASSLFSNEKFHSNNKNKRIIFITDMRSFNENNFINLYKDLSLSNIFITVLGISESFNTELQEKVGHVKGSNYYVCEHSEDIKKYLVEQFNYVCFPASYDIDLTLYSSHIHVKKVIGSGYKDIVVKQDNKDISSGSYNQFIFQFQKEVMFLMCYFKYVKKVFPKPVLSCIFEYLKCSKKSICKVDTTFPSSLKKINGQYFSEGGMILLNVETERKDTKIDNSFPFSISLKYTETNGDKKIQRYQYYLKDISKENTSYFSDNSIKKAISLYYYAKFLRKIMKRWNGEGKKKTRPLPASKQNKINENISSFFEQNYINEGEDSKKAHYINEMQKIVLNSHN